MVVYIEYVIADNLTFTALICAISYWIMREKVKKVRTAFATLVGTICAVIYPLIKSVWLVLCFKAALFVVMSIILYAGNSRPLLHSMCFLLGTAIVGGVQFMVGFIVHGNAIAALKVPIGDFPLSIFVLTPLCLFMISKSLLGKINAHRLKQNYIYDVKLTMGGKETKLKALVDTGNSVKADKDVVFIGKLTALDILGAEYITLSRSASSMTIHTAAGDKKIILLPGKIELYSGTDEHIFMDVQVGIGDIRKGEYEAILPLNIINKEKVL